MEFLDYLLSPPVTALLCAVLVASARGWQFVPVLLLGFSQLPRLYAQANQATLGAQGEAFVRMLGDGVMVGLYVALALMIVSPRTNPRQSCLPIVAAAALFGFLPYLVIETLGVEVAPLMDRFFA